MTELITWAPGDAALAKGPICCAIGNFDGVHKGHQQLISHARQAARQAGLPLAVICFSPHPRSYFQPDNPPFLLLDQQSKYDVLAKQEVDLIIEIVFNQTTQMMAAEQFVKTVLSDALQVKKLFAGADFAFGKGRAGTMQFLKEYGQPLGIEVTAISLLTKDDHQVISSTVIREALKKPDLELVKTLLGRPHSISGLVIEGDKRGRQLAFPTANIAIESCLAPAFGVYAITADLDQPEAGNAPIFGVANIGKRPTVNDRGILAEAHLFDFDQDIYGRRLTIHLHGFLRSEQKFSGLDALVTQIGLDVDKAKQCLITHGYTG